MYRYNRVKFLRVKIRGIGFSETLKKFAKNIEIEDLSKNKEIYENK